jgi:hypothetical protein
MLTVKKVTANGDKVTWSLQPCNDSNIKCSMGKVTFTIPDGVTLSGPSDPDSTVIDVSQGVFDNSNDTWLIGDLDPKQCAPVTTFEFTVDNISLANPEDDRFIVTAVFTTSCEETISSDNTNSLVIEVTDGCENINLSMTPSASSNNSVDLSIS